MIRRTATFRGAAAALAALGAAAGLTACTTPLDRAWAKSQRAHVAQTTANPGAGEDDLEARRPDGASTDAALYKYREQETTVDSGASPPVINVDIGGGS